MLFGSVTRMQLELKSASTLAFLFPKAQDTCNPSWVEPSFMPRCVEGSAENAISII